ncbi:Histidine kinase-, DNA gyrase B-, and HSP90-like ATPase [Actinacidiphila bryophytorum]|uniref:histidine kinase n=2 Tax=Actinacidiphila bryophytorum TaxID=1436133 RepID=A0A9W4MEM9_9ACTN|nr:sensor histidine kinase [Actinacidiphila bryophytorum]CAG7650344.1 Histidine kinase-, DNA gyrase B-, and HSP90-like ATPase [Actinacidiphila bryophytorum]
MGAVVRALVPEVARDAALACGLFAVCLVVNNPRAVVSVASAGSADGAVRGLTVACLWWTATAALLVAVTFRRRLPVTMLAVCTAATACHVVLAVPPMVVDTGVPVVLCTVAAHRGRAVSLAALAALIALVSGWSAYYANHGRLAPGLPMTATQVFHRTPSEAGDAPSGPDDVSTQLRDPSANAWNTAFVYGIALVAAWSTGYGARNRRAYLGQLHQRAQGLERERDQRATLAVAAERARISREIHDVVAHGLSVIVIQAQGAAAALDDDPAETRTALEAVVTIGRDSLADMRRVLTATSGPGDLAATGEDGDAWRPPPGLGRLPALLDRLNRAGTPVRLRIEGSPSELPTAVDLSAYRIVQEALTNTIKHAGAGAAADVLVAYDPSEVCVEIRDDGRGRQPVVGDGGGPGGADGPIGVGDMRGIGAKGLRGMRERAKLLGGSFTAGPGPHGGFVVRTVLPIHAPDLAAAGPGPAARGTDPAHAPRDRAGVPGPDIQDQGT